MPKAERLFTRSWTLIERRGEGVRVLGVVVDIPLPGLPVKERYGLFLPLALDHAVGEGEGFENPARASKALLGMVEGRHARRNG